MSIKLLIPLVLIFFLFLYFTFLNPASVSVTLHPEVTYRVPLVVLVMVSFFLGAVIAFFISFFQVFRLQLTEFRTKRKEYLRHTIDTWYEEALAFLALGRKKDAEQRFQKILKSVPDHFPTLLELGRHHRESGDTGTAIEFHARAKTGHPQSLRALAELAEDHLAARRPDQAYDAVLELEKRKGESRSLYRKLRDSFIQKRNWEKAHVCQKKILWFPQEKSEAEAERRVLIGLEYEMAHRDFRRGETKRAFDNLKKILRSDREFVPAYLLYSEMCQDQGNTKEAVKILQKGFRNSGSLVCLRRLEDLFLQLDRKEEIRNLYRTAGKEHPGDRTLRILGMCAAVKYGDPKSIRGEVSEYLQDGTRTTLIRLLEGVALTRGRVQWDSPAVVQEALKGEIALRFKNQCARCGFRTTEYAARCEACGEWGSSAVVLEE